MQFSIVYFLVFIIPSTQSTGFLSLKLTSDHDCLVHLEIQSMEYSETVRLLAYETKSLEIFTPGITNQLSIHFQILHHFSGVSLSDVSSQLFKLDNNGIWEPRVIDSDQVILSIQSNFHCQKGFYGPICERRSRSTSTIKTTTSIPTATSSPFHLPISEVQINNLIIYAVLSSVVLLLIIANCFLCFCRPKPSKYIDYTFQNVFPMDEFFPMEKTIGSPDTEYFVSSSRYYSTITLQSRV
ncbi:hypothetical protein L5515_004904 [Caenorhabditis briggsae]|uniref:Skn-1 dependent zygotic transcript 1 protein n=1 Tax=Caenorhabditis briggsae TaxID=6238 RepID=A0AAE9JE27_CAEBR|nr:hypothetical protein L5515_004904 [Caenorhabditis briggsae]